MYKHVEVYYAYAPEDQTWVQELEKHLKLLQRQGLISTWHPRLIAAGEDWQHVTDSHFRKASIILLLISPDFLASDYCYSYEMNQAFPMSTGNMDHLLWLIAQFRVCLPATCVLRSMS